MKQLLQTLLIVVLAMILFKYSDIFSNFFIPRDYERSNGYNNRNKFEFNKYKQQDSSQNSQEFNYYSDVFKFSKEVEEALVKGYPIVALESTIVSHGMPFPQNYETAKAVEKIIRDRGVVPATIAIINGKIHVGLSDEEIYYLSKVGLNSVKTSRRDLAYVVSQGKTGSTTVSSTIFISNMVGIKIFVTGGLGGVHRNAEVSMDISADLTELGKNGVAVVCAGVKSILDIGKTLEYLETQGVTVLSYKTSEFPAFFTKNSGFQSPIRLDNTYDIAKVIHSNDELTLNSGIVIAVPNQSDDAEEEINKAIMESIEQSEKDLIRGKDITPYLLKMVNDKTKGKSLGLNIDLIKNNAKVGSEIALHYYNLRNKRNTLSSPSPIKQIETQEQQQKSQKEQQQQKSPNVIEGRPKSLKKINNDIIVIGGCVIDMISRPNKISGFRMATSNPGEIDIKMGGVSRNIVEVLARLDQSPMFISAVGDDEHSKLLMNHFDSFNLNTDSIGKIANQKTAIYNAILDGNGDLSVAVSQMDIFNSLTPEYLKRFEWNLIAAKILVIDANIPIESMIYLSDLIKTRNPDIQLWFEPTSHYKSMKSIIANISSVITYTSPNTDELFKMSFEITKQSPHLHSLVKSYEDKSLESIKSHTKVLIENGMKFVITKMGKDGMLLSYKSKENNEYIFKIYKAPNVKDHDIVDVTGAGDSLCGGVIYGLLNNLDIDKSIHIGSLCAKASLESSHPVSPILSNSYINKNI